MAFDLDAIKDKLGLCELWQKLNLGGTPIPGKVYRSPFRQDRTPSLSIRVSDKHWHDFGSGAGGDIFDLYVAATGCTLKVAYTEVSKLAGMNNDPSYRPLVSPREEKRFTKALPEGWTANQIADKNAAINRLLFDQDENLLKFLTRKKISPTMLDQLAKQGDIGLDSRNRLSYFFEHGWKVRTDYDSSHGDRWVFGKAGNNLWRIQHATSETKNVYLMEGESDTLYLNSARPQRLFDLYCGIPGASWTPDPVMAYRVGAHRNVFLCFDWDDAGRDAVQRIGKILKAEATATNVFYFDWRKVWPKLPDKLDIGDLKESFFGKRFDECFNAL